MLSLSHNFSVGASLVIIRLTNRQYLTRFIDKKGFGNGLSRAPRRHDGYIHEGGIIERLRDQQEEIVTT
jgi:hypothetical protein